MCCVYRVQLGLFTTLQNTTIKPEKYANHNCHMLENIGRNARKYQYGMLCKIQDETVHGTDILRCKQSSKLQNIFNKIDRLYTVHEQFEYVKN